MSKTAKHALSLVSSSAFSVPKTALAKLRKTTAEQVAAVYHMEHVTAMAAITAGLNLHRTKASLEHGDFRPYIEQELAKSCGWTSGTAVKNASYFMRLATAFLEKARLSSPAVLAGLNGEEKNGGAFQGALKKFVGEHSLTELLIKHDIKGVGLKTALTIEAGDDDNTPVDLEAVRARTWEQTYAAVKRLRSAFTEPEKLQLLTDPKQIETLHDEALEVTRLANARLEALKAQKAA